MESDRRRALRWYLVSLDLRPSFADVIRPLLTLLAGVFALVVAVVRVDAAAVALAIAVLLVGYLFWPRTPRPN